MFFGHSAKRPHPSRVKPPPLLPTPMDEPDGVFRSKQPACVVGGRASGGRGSRPFPRALQGATVAGLQHRNSDNNSSKADTRRPAAVAADAAAAAGTKTGLAAVTKPSRRAQRGVPLVQWVWPANSGIARVGSEWFRGAAASGKQVSQENPGRVQGKMQGRTRKSSSVVVGTVCEPVRPTRLDLSSSQGYPTSSRVIYTAKGGHTNPADAVAPSGTTAAAVASATASRKAKDSTDTTTNAASTRPPALNLPLHHPHEAPWLDSSPGRGGGGGFGSGGARSRAYSSNSAAAAGLQSPRYLQSTTVSQAKAVEPAGKSRASDSRASRRVGSARRGGNGGRGRSRSRSRGRGSADEGGSDDGGFGGGGNGGGFGGPGGMLESLGGFLGIGKGGDGAGNGRSKPRGGAGNTASRTSGGGGGGGGGEKMGSKVFRRLRKSTEMKHSRYGSVKIKAPSHTSSMGGGGRAPAADISVQQQKHHHHRAVLRRDERDIVTMHTPGVLRPEGVRLRVVKASGRTLEDTKFHMEIRTQRPGQVWSVCRKHKEFQSLHSCLQGRFPALVLPRLPRPPQTGGGIVLEPATLERARAGLQTYIAAVVAKVPAAWGLEEFVMFLDSDEKGRRLFSRRKRKKETRRVIALPCPALSPETEEDGEEERKEEEEEEEEEEEREEEEEEEESRPAARTAKFAPDLVSPRVTPVVDGGGSQKSLLDLKVEEKKQALKALEGEAANHFDGVGAVMNTAVSFSSDDDDGDSDLDFEEGNDFIDGEDAIRAMLDRDADEAEDDNLFSIPAGTDFGIPFDDDDDDEGEDDDDDDDIGGSFDITYRG